jgi:hypothetical protein
VLVVSFSPNAHFIWKDRVHGIGEELILSNPIQSFSLRTLLLGTLVVSSVGASCETRYGVEPSWGKPGKLPLPELIQNHSMRLYSLPDVLSIKYPLPGFWLLLIRKSCVFYLGVLS